MERVVPERRTLHPAFKFLIAGGLALNLNLLTSCSNDKAPLYSEATPGTVPQDLATVPTSPETSKPPQTTTTKAPETTTTTTAKKERLEHIISSDGVGKIYIGQPKVSVDETYSFSPTCGGNEFLVNDAHTDVGISFDAQDKVDQISIYGIGVETLDGVEVGTKQEDVVKAYPGKGGPTTSVYKDNNGSVDVLVVPGSDADTNFMITPKDGARRVTSIVITQPGQPIDLAC